MIQSMAFFSRFPRCPKFFFAIEKALRFKVQHSNPLSVHDFIPKCPVTFQIDTCKIPK